MARRAASATLRGRCDGALNDRFDGSQQRDAGLVAGQLVDRPAVRRIAANVAKLLDLGLDSTPASCPAYASQTSIS